MQPPHSLWCGGHGRGGGRGQLARAQLVEVAVDGLGGGALIHPHYHQAKGHHQPNKTSHPSDPEIKKIVVSGIWKKIVLLAQTMLISVLEIFPMCQ